MSAYSNNWFEKEDYTKFGYKRVHGLEQYLNWISNDIQVINKYLLNNDYDTVREYAGYAENNIERARKTMEENPEMKSPKIEKFLEESLNKVKAALRRCPSRNSNTTWSGRYEERERESEEEKRARWRYEDSQREYRNMQELLKQPWYY